VITSGQDTALVTARGTQLILDSAREAGAGATVATILLTPAGLLALIVGTKARELLKSGELTIDGEKRKATALINSIAATKLLAGLRSGQSRSATPA
jgi:hypothetical protein